MCLSSDGERLFVAHDDGSASIHRALTGESMRESLIPKSECTAATWSEDGRNVAIATADGSIRLLDAETGRQVWQNKDKHSFEEWFCYSAWESSSSLD